ncbi:hypothetical protein AMJ86_10570 [bacterium SM23_57]|nr:MAG: hypothetical protein AMJ86_10570 [bacterium SM23_57]
MSTYLRVGFTREALRSFYLNHKYFTSTAVDFMVKQHVLQTVSMYGKTWYGLAEYDNSSTNINPFGQDPREDTRWGWRIGLQYAWSSWVNLGFYGEFQQRDSNVDIPFGNYDRTLIGATASFHSPR